MPANAGVHTSVFPGLSAESKVTGTALTAEVLKLVANAQAWYDGTPLELLSTGGCRTFIPGTSTAWYGFSREQTATTLPVSFGSYPPRTDAAGNQRIQCAVADIGTTFRGGGLRSGVTAAVGDLVGFYTTGGLWYWDTAAAVKTGRIVSITPGSEGANQNLAVAGGRVDVEPIISVSQYSPGGAAAT